MVRNITDVIFDLGGVIINLHTDRTVQAFSELAQKDASLIYNYQNQQSLFDDFEVGKISAEEFRIGLRKWIQQPVNTTMLDNAWNAMLGDIPKSHIVWVQQLRKQRKIYVLSNTNSIHVDCINHKLKIHHRVSDLEEVFDSVYFSHEIGYRKPDPEAFSYILNKYALTPEQTLFIDDKEENTKAANALGMHTITLKHLADLPTEVDSFLKSDHSGLAE